MARGVFTATSGAVTALQRLDVVAHNLAQVRTPGFKLDGISVHQVTSPDHGMGPAGRRPQTQHYAQSYDDYVDTRQGAIVATGNPLDVAIEGNGWLRVAGEGGERLTRDGRLHLGADGLLRHRTGALVLGDDGHPIVLRPDRVPVIEGNGSIKIDQVEVRRLGVRAVAKDTLLDKDGHGFVKVPEDAPAEDDFKILQGSLEDANVNPVEMMTRLVTVQRHFEALQRVVDTAGQMDDAATRLAGR